MIFTITRISTAMDGGGSQHHHRHLVVFVGKVRSDNLVLIGSTRRCAPANRVLPDTFL